MPIAQNPQNRAVQGPSKLAVWAFLGAIFFAVQFAALFTPPLLDDVDASHAQVAQHMIQSGDWVTMKLDGIRYLEKPPLPYWLDAICYWIFGQKILDLSAYGKFVDNLVRNFSDTTVTLGSQHITLQGIGESQYGADAGASASLSLTSTARLYLNYDAKFRAAMQSHQGTVGVELKW